MRAVDAANPFSSALLNHEACCIGFNFFAGSHGIFEFRRERFVLSKVVTSVARGIANAAEYMLKPGESEKATEACRLLCFQIGSHFRIAVIDVEC